MHLSSFFTVLLTILFITNLHIQKELKALFHCNKLHKRIGILKWFGSRVLNIRKH